jgi:glycosyltransferase involved in cell wall biosynthesis
MPLVTIVVPAFNVSKTISATLQSLLTQTFDDYEILVIDDGSTDATQDILRSFSAQSKMRIVQQGNRGLAGARNTGIAEAAGSIIGFCDADDLWEADKLATHVQHLQDNPQIGVSYSGSLLIDADGKSLGISQMPRLHGVTAAHVLKRNPIGNGSAGVFRREVFDEIAFRPASETVRDWYFDETFRQSEDIECWLRIALTTEWAFEGVPGLLTQYRVNDDGLSAVTDKQLASWERMIKKLTPLAEPFFANHGRAARAYQLRYLARRAVSALDGPNAVKLIKASLNQSKRPLIEEPRKTIVTLLATIVLRFGGPTAISLLMQSKDARA